MRVLLAEIVSGARPEGTSLPREADLAKQFGVSRGVARECIRSLEERGLISVKHGRGATVLPERDWDVFDPDVLTALLRRGGRLDALREFLECRTLLEVQAAGLAAERATDEDLTKLSAAFERMTDAADRALLTPAGEDLYQEADIAFHRAIIDATENRALARITEPLHRALSAAIQPLARPERRLERALPEHEAILTAILDRDPETARQSMRDHLSTVETYLQEFTESSAPPRAPAATASGS